MLLVLEFVFCRLPELFFRSKVTTVSRIFIQIVGPGAALTNVVAAIWHGSQIAAEDFILSYIICAAIVVRVGRSTLPTLRDEKERLEKDQNTEKQKLQ